MDPHKVLEFHRNHRDDGEWRKEVEQAREWRKGSRRGRKPTLVRLHGSMAPQRPKHTKDRNKKRLKQQKQQLPDADVYL